MCHLGRTVKNENTGYGADTCRGGVNLILCQVFREALMPSPFEERPEEHDGERPETPAKGAFKQQERGGGRGKVGWGGVRKRLACPGLARSSSGLSEGGREKCW